MKKYSILLFIFIPLLIASLSMARREIKWSSIYTLECRFENASYKECMEVLEAITEDEELPIYYSDVADAIRRLAEVGNKRDERCKKLLLKLLRRKKDEFNTIPGSPLRGLNFPTIDWGAIDTLKKLYGKDCIQNLIEVHDQIVEDLTRDELLELVWYEKGRKGWSYEEIKALYPYPRKLPGRRDVERICNVRSRIREAVNELGGKIEERVLIEPLSPPTLEERHAKVDPYIKILEEDVPKVKELYEKVNALDEKRDHYAAREMERAKANSDLREKVDHAVLQVGVLKDPLATPALIEALYTGEMVITQHAMEALGKIGDVRVIPNLLKFLEKKYYRDESTNEYLRREAVSAIERIALANIENDEVIDEILYKLDLVRYDEYKEVRERVPSCIAKIKQKRAKIKGKKEE